MDRDLRGGVFPDEIAVDAVAGGADGIGHGAPGGQVVELAEQRQILGRGQRMDDHQLGLPGSGEKQGAIEGAVAPMAEVGRQGDAIREAVMGHVSSSYPLSSWNQPRRRMTCFSASSTSIRAAPITASSAQSAGASGREPKIAFMKGA